MRNKKVYVFVGYKCVGRDKNGCTKSGYIVARDNEGSYKLTNSPFNCWYHPLEIFRYYWFGKWCIKHPKLYMLFFAKIKVILSNTFLNY